MIRLYEALPNTITVQGKDFLIKTDFRYWLLFYEIVQDKCTLQDLTFLFVDDYPLCDFTEELMAFFTNPNSTPNGSGTDERLFDYIEDGEYIYASFLASYGIDLIDIDELHWWKFKALFLGLPDDSKMKQIMSMRGYRKDNRSIEKQYEDNKRAWSLPQEVDQEILDEINDVFYGA